MLCTLVHFSAAITACNSACCLKLQLCSCQTYLKGSVTSCVTCSVIFVICLLPCLSYVSCPVHKHVPWCRTVRAILWAGLAGFMLQWALFLRLTFWELSWDVMEPVRSLPSCCG